jgi:hypothetical protein
VSPKVGFLWTPWKDTHFRGAYTRSLGGLFFDTSVRLEPAQLAGFTQSYRSLIPESVRGLLAGSQFETFGLAFDHKFPTETYVGVEAELLTSSSERAFGIYNSAFLQPLVASTTPEQMDFEEKSVLFTVNQLLGREWSVGTSYRVSEARLKDRFIEFPAATTFASVEPIAVLQQVHAYAIYDLPCGFFSIFDAAWYRQNNEGYTPDIPGDDFWQLNAYAGYRFLRRRAEIRVGVLNLTDQDYQLNPLNLYSELPRDRTFTARLRFNF